LINLNKNKRVKKFLKITSFQKSLLEDIYKVTNIKTQKLITLEKLKKEQIKHKERKKKRLKSKKNLKKLTKIRKFLKIQTNKYVSAYFRKADINTPVNQFKIRKEKKWKASWKLFSKIFFFLKQGKINKYKKKSLKTIVLY